MVEGNEYAQEQSLISPSRRHKKGEKEPMERFVGLEMASKAEILQPTSNQAVTGAGAAPAPFVRQKIYPEMFRNDRERVWCGRLAVFVGDGWPGSCHPSNGLPLDEWLRFNANVKEK